MNHIKRFFTLVLVLTLFVTLVPMSRTNAAVKKTKLNKTKVTIYVGKTTSQRKS